MSLLRHFVTLNPGFMKQLRRLARKEEKAYPYIIMEWFKAWIASCDSCNLSESYEDCCETCNQLVNLEVFRENKGQVILNAEWLRKLYRTVKCLRKLYPHASANQILENAVLTQITALPDLPVETAAETIFNLAELTVAKIRHDTPQKSRPQ